MLRLMFNLFAWFENARLASEQECLTFVRFARTRRNRTRHSRALNWSEGNWPFLCSWNEAILLRMRNAWHARNSNKALSRQRNQHFSQTTRREMRFCSSRNVTRAMATQKDNRTKRIRNMRADCHLCLTPTSSPSISHVRDVRYLFWYVLGEHMR